MQAKSEVHVLRVSARQTHTTNKQENTHCKTLNKLTEIDGLKLEFRDSFTKRRDVL